MKTFGKYPASTTRLQRMGQSPNYKNGAFHNIHPTPMNAPGGSSFKAGLKFFFSKKPADIKPSKNIPAIKIDLHKISDDVPTIIWFGHSSYLIKFHGKNYLIDPVFSGHASPFSSVIPSFPGSDIYSVHDLPHIDVLILTHDHYDHIDFETVMELKNKVDHIVCPLGVGEHLEYWGFANRNFTELDWWGHHELFPQIRITATPSRHFSGRKLSRNKTLWASYVFELDSYKIFIGGDSGYDDQFKKIGETFKSFDLVMLECGQYNESWPYIHMFPEQTAQAAQDLNAKILFPVHWGKFILSTHSWTDSIERVLLKAKELKQKVITPRIGEVVYLNQNFPTYTWWKE